MICICLCNTIFRENKENDEFVFHGTSPDEIALINAARYFKYIFLKRSSGNSGTKISLDIFDKVHEFTINNYLEYTSERYLINLYRKCMSVIVTSPEGKMYLFTKGADSVIREKVLNKHLIEVTDNYMFGYAKLGLRTLMLSYKQLNIEEYNTWNEIYNVSIIFFNVRNLF